VRISALALAFCSIEPGRTSGGYAECGFRTGTHGNREAGADHSRPLRLQLRPRLSVLVTNEGVAVIDSLSSEAMAKHGTPAHRGA